MIDFPMASTSRDPHAHARPGSSRGFKGLSPGDPYSYSRPEYVRVTDIHLELTVDFDQKVLKGKAILTIKKIEPSSNEIILDSYKLDISKVTDVVTGGKLTCVPSEHDDIFGSKLSIRLPQAADKSCKIQIEYKTTSDSPALYWLTPQQTANGEYPFLLSNNKLIYARSWFPCQDTPSNKFTYSAKISVPKHFTVLMSTHSKNEPKEDPENSTLKVYEFRQMHRVPSYTVVIAVGVLKYEKLSERIGMWTENMKPEYVNLCKQTFRRTEDMLNIAENLYGAYPWGSFNICVLPPSVSHFEIECPGLIFVSPTLLGGDITLVSSIARNISQHWTGILVTCANYNHLWLNKSFSLYISESILKGLDGLDGDLMDVIRRRYIHDLEIMVDQHKSLGLLTCLIHDTDDLFSAMGTKLVPYEKGCMLLKKLQNEMKGFKNFQHILKEYLTNFAYSSITTDDWKEFLYKRSSKKEAENMNTNINWKDHFYKSDYPPELFREIALPKYNRTKVCHDLASRWIHWDDATTSSFTEADIEGFCDVQKIVFLNDLLYNSNATLSRKKIFLMANIYQFDKDDMNDEIRFVWLRLCIKNRCTPWAVAAFKFAIKFSSPKFTYPIVKDLYNLSGYGDNTVLYLYDYARTMGILKEIGDKIKQILNISDESLNQVYMDFRHDESNTFLEAVEMLM